jgi:hypothetical protein
MQTAGKLPMTGSLEIKMRVYYSSYHLWAAKHFTEKVAKIEEEHVGRSVFNIEHRAYATNVILSAVAFLEAGINEVFQDVADNHTSYIEGLTPEARRLMAILWNMMANKSVLDKYELALTLSKKEPFQTDIRPFQDVKLLIGLRNTLVHYKPKTLGSIDEPDIQKKLKGKFRTNKLMEGSGNPFFPDKCLGHGCCEWAVNASSAFADIFFSRIGIVPNYQKAKLDG